MDDTNQLKKKRGSTVQNFFQQLVRLKPVRGKSEKTQKQKLMCHYFFLFLRNCYCVFLSAGLINLKRLNFCSEVI